MTVVTVFFALAFAAMSWLWVDVSRAALAKQNAQTISDMSVLSSLRITVESLQTVASRWNEFGAVFGAASTDGTVDLPLSQWPTVFKKAADLKKALPGYQGRSTAIVKVVAEANGVARDEVNVIDAVGAQMALRAERARVRDENGHVEILEGAWYSRRWAVSNTGDRDGRVWHAAQATVVPREGAAWLIVTPAHGRIAWDVRADARPQGNHGYPANWNDAVKNNRLDPHRWPVFRALLEPQ